MSFFPSVFQIFLTRDHYSKVYRPRCLWPRWRSHPRCGLLHPLLTHLKALNPSRFRGLFCASLPHQTSWFEGQSGCASLLGPQHPPVCGDGPGSHCCSGESAQVGGVSADHSESIQGSEDKRMAPGQLAGGLSPLAS